MNYRTLSIVISIIVFVILYLMAEFPGSWTIIPGVIGIPLLIVYLTIQILRAPDVDKEPPAKYKWYHH